MTTRVFPATELHLLPNVTVDLRFFTQTSAGWIDFTTFPGTTTLESATDGAVADYAHPTITAKAAGTSILRISLEAGAPATRQILVPVRVVVHATLTRLFVARSTLEVERDRKDRVLTVYAEFDDGGTKTTADVTRHPFLTYTVTTTSGTPNVTVPGGRVVTGAGVGKAKIEIGVAAALGLTVAPVTVDVDVVAKVTDRPILKEVQRGTAVRTRSLVFLGDGFTTADEPAFNTLVKDINQRLWQLSPFTLLKESFDVYQAFVPSAESGCTAGPRITTARGKTFGWPQIPDQPLAANTVGIDDLVFGRQTPRVIPLGLPTDPSPPATAAAAATKAGVAAAAVPAQTFQAWQDLPKAAGSRLRETFFGIVIGGRPNGTSARETDVGATTRADLDVLAPGDEVPRAMLFDERRLPDLADPANDPKRAHLAALDAFLATLRPPGGPADFGRRWTTGGPDAGLVVILGNADHYGGIRLDGCILLSIGGGIQHRITAAGTVPGLVEIAPVARPIAAGGADHKDGFRERPAGSLADRVAHELGHAVPMGNLNDEYGGGRNPAAASFAPFAESAPNTQMLAAVLSGTHVDAARLKWNQWPRLDGAVVPEALTGTGQRLLVTVNAEDWLALPTLTAGRAMILRARALIAGPAPAPALPAPVQLAFRAADATLNRLELDVPAGTTAEALRTTFRDNAVLLIPRLSTAGTAITLVDTRVATELLATGPFGASGAGCALNAAPTAPVIAGIPAARLPRVIAAYESAAEANCQVVRPTLDCKMRTVVEMLEPPVDFCFVCKYVIVDAIAPRAHAALDGEYPT